MADEGFGSELWKNAQSVRFGTDGGLELPVRATPRDGIVVGVDAVAKSDAAAAAPAAPRSPGRWRRLFRRRST